MTVNSQKMEQHLQDWGGGEWLSDVQAFREGQRRSEKQQQEHHGIISVYELLDIWSSPQAFTSKYLYNLFHELGSLDPGHDPDAVYYYISTYSNSGMMKCPLKH